MLEYPFPVPAADASVQQVVPGVLWARMPMPMALNHINVYLLEDDDGWYGVDTGLQLDQVKKLWQTLVDTQLKGKPLKGLICTHFHYDHAGLAPWLTQTFNIPLYMSFGEYFFMRSVGAQRNPDMVEQLTRFYQVGGVPPQEITDIIKAVVKDPFVGHFPNTFNRLREGEQLAIGARKWQVVIGEGHSPEHACLWCEQDGILLAGDQLLPEISSNVLVNEIEPNANPLALWLKSLDRLEQFPADTLVLPAHGPVFRGIKPRSRALIEHHHTHLDLLESAALQGLTLWQAMQVMFNRQLSSRKLGPVEKMLALGETQAHLNYLCDAARLEKNNVREQDGEQYIKLRQQDQKTQ
ncbi:MBL fold metallo-hydrolase [Shewanella corallii]|uniref:MBL fold metallo-hydrolase n=1 Tax=Shewanella corallii TaxID=560080 RepID=A0ABT0N6E3_9GAMM|nr:MBL fold metallo-hydrolase [Shewanella corallii]MCL2913969.1 MBL fold metallo-hydrolase [Shewanella corallii]